MKVSIDILYHCRCDECGAWWSVGDRVPIEEYCPNCGWKSDATEIKNGRGEDVLGVYWDYPLHPKPPIDPIDIAINKVDDALKTCDKLIQLAAEHPIHSSAIEGKVKGDRQ